MSAANSRQVAGRHYKSEYQHWDFAHETFGAGYFQGQITKYVYRWRKKNGVEDLQKAAHFLQKLLELKQHERFTMVRKITAVLRMRRPPRALEQFIVSNDVAGTESWIIICVTRGDIASLHTASVALGKLIMQNTRLHDSGVPGSGYVKQG